jgi:hypothetical protein
MRVIPSVPPSFGYSFSHKYDFSSVQDFLVAKESVRPTPCKIPPGAILHDKALVVLTAALTYSQPEERLETKVVRRKRFSTIDAHIADATGIIPLHITNQGIFKLDLEQLAALTDGIQLNQATLIFEPKRDWLWLVKYVPQDK